MTPRSTSWTTTRRSSYLDIDRKRRPAANAQGRMTFLHGAFDVLRVMIAAANDDQVFETPRDEQLGTVQKKTTDHPFAGKGLRPYPQALPGIQRRGVFSGLRQYPWATLGPETHISPNFPGIAPKAQLSGSVMSTSLPQQGIPMGHPTQNMRPLALCAERPQPNGQPMARAPHLNTKNSGDRPSSRFDRIPAVSLSARP